MLLLISSLIMEYSKCNSEHSKCNADRILSKSSRASKKSRWTLKYEYFNILSAIAGLVRVIQYQYPILSPCSHRQHPMKSPFIPFIIYEIRWDRGIARSERKETKQLHKGRMGTMPSHEIGFI